MQATTNAALTIGPNALAHTLAPILIIPLIVIALYFAGRALRLCYRAMRHLATHAGTH